jgi:hypothetical protein
MFLEQSFTCEGHMGTAARRPNCVAIVLKPIETPRRQIPSIYLSRALTNMRLAPHCNSCPVLTHHWLSSITAAPGNRLCPVTDLKPPVTAYILAAFTAWLYAVTDGLSPDTYSITIPHESLLDALIGCQVVSHNLRVSTRYHLGSHWPHDFVTFGLLGWRFHHHPLSS